MKFLIYLISLLSTNIIVSQVYLDADGPGNTYNLISSVLAPGYNPIETPDCNHAEFGDHITEEFDNELNTNVFRFHIHTSPDNDRCIKVDRQRNEIKTYDKSPDNLLGTENETITYRWKFYLEDGFQSSPNFTHIHQLKSVGGDLESMPMYTLTTRKGSPDRIELRYAETTKQETLLQTDLTPFIGTWVSVVETIKYGNPGTYQIEIQKTSDATVLMTYTNNSIINWRLNADFVRPKWGIYRSLINVQDLRDETISFANFSIEELNTNSVPNLQDTPLKLHAYLDQNSKILKVKNLHKKVDLIQLLSMDGRKILEKKIALENEIGLEVSNITNGIYIITAKGNNISQTEQIIISH